MLDFFEKCVQKTLTAPIKASTIQEGAAAEKVNPFSPLLTTVVSGLAAAMEEGSTETNAALLTFVRKTFFGFLGHSQSMDLPEALASSLKTELAATKAAKGTPKLLKDCLKIIEKQAEVKGDDEIKERLSEETLSALSPVKENVFASLSDDPAALFK